MRKGTIQNRDQFLNHIAHRLGRERKQDVRLPEWEFQPQWQVYHDKSADELYTLFKKNSEEKGTYVVETTKEKLGETMESIMAAYGPGSMVATKDRRFEEYGLHDVLTKNNVHVWDKSFGDENIEAAKEASIGFLFSDVSLAESGTITQFNDSDIARSVSLLPVTYAAIVPKSSIVPRLTQATEKIQKQVEDGEDISSYINFISGPSNSADIEMNIVVGVHGPVKAAHIVVMDA